MFALLNRELTWVCIASFCCLLGCDNQQFPEIENRRICQSNLQALHRAINAYRNSHGGNYPQNIADKDGEPLLSWRVRLLPYLEQEELFRRFDLQKSWQSPPNKYLVSKLPAVFRCPNVRTDGTVTSYRAGWQVEGDQLLGDGSLECLESGNLTTIWTKPDVYNIEDFQSLGTVRASAHGRRFFGVSREGDAVVVDLHDPMKRKIHTVPQEVGSPKMAPKK